MARATWIGVRVHVVAEQLQRLFGRDQRLVGVLQPFEQLLLREAVLLARQDAEHALTQLRIRVVRDLAQGGEIVAAARLECDDAEACRLQRLQCCQPHRDRLVLVAQDVQHRLQVLVALADGQAALRPCAATRCLTGFLSCWSRSPCARASDRFAAIFAFSPTVSSCAALRFVAIVSVSSCTARYERHVVVIEAHTGGGVDRRPDSRGSPARAVAVPAR